MQVNERVAVSETLEYLAVSYFNGNLSVFDVPYLPLLKNVLGTLSSLGLDDRVDLLLKASTPNTPLEFDRAELTKLQPFNDFLRKKALDNMEAIQLAQFPDPIHSSKCKTRLKPVAPELLMKELIDQAQKRKAQLLEVSLLDPVERSEGQERTCSRAEQEACSRPWSKGRPEPSGRLRSKPETSQPGKHEDPADC